MHVLFILYSGKYVTLNPKEARELMQWYIDAGVTNKSRTLWLLCWFAVSVEREVDTYTSNNISAVWFRTTTVCHLTANIRASSLQLTAIFCRCGLEMSFPWVPGVLWLRGTGRVWQTCACMTNGYLCGMRPLWSLCKRISQSGCLACWVSLKINHSLMNFRALSVLQSVLTCNSYGTIKIWCIWLWMAGRIALKCMLWFQFY